METQQFILSKYINEGTEIEILLKKLYNEHHVMSKDYPEHNLVVLYNKYNTKRKTKLEMECRSVVLDRSTNQIICTTCPTPIYNIDAVNYIWKNPNVQKDTYICYEGSLVSLFNYNNNWFLSTRKCIFNKESEEVGHYKMFMDVLRKDGYPDLDSFTKLLDCNTSYHFVIIHHSNENVVNYKKEFGDLYMKLCFIFARNRLTQAEYKSEDIDSINLSDNIFLPKKIENTVEYDTMNVASLQNISEPPVNEGVVIKMNGMILKIQNASYQFHKAIGSEKNMYRGFLYLYQNNTLKPFFENNSVMDIFKKIVNPLNTKESYDMIGMIDCLFKVLTSELFNLFLKLYDKDGNQLNCILYSKLPEEYKNLLFQIRGLLFQNKKKHTASYQQNKTVDYLQLKDVYYLLKSIEIRALESFIRCRKLMLNWSKLEKTDETDIYSTTLYLCDKIFYKLATIYTIKLFPEIMPEDTPWSNQ
jgi:hypothetical protein